MNMPPGNSTNITEEEHARDAARYLAITTPEIRFIEDIIMFGDGKFYLSNDPGLPVGKGEQYEQDTDHEEAF